MILKNNLYVIEPLGKTFGFFYTESADNQPIRLLFVKNSTILHKVRKKQAQVFLSLLYTHVRERAYVGARKCQSKEHNLKTLFNYCCILIVKKTKIEYN